MNIAFMVACVDEAYVDKPVIPIDKNKVTIEIFTRSQNFKLPESRGGSSNESFIEKTPYIIVFKNEVCTEVVQAMENSDTQKRYVQLTKDSSGDFQFLILANNGTHFYWGEERKEWTVENLHACLERETLSDISNNLLTDKLESPLHTSPPYAADRWDYILPMSHLTEPPVSEINESTEIGNSGSPLELIRGLAKVVFINEPELYLDSESNTKLPYNPFDMEGVITVKNISLQGKVYNHNGTPLNELTEIATDTEYQGVIYPMENITEDWAPPYYQASWGINVGYFYETAANQDTYFIIRGELTADFGSGVKEPRTFYYKMALLDNEQKPMGIVRNHEYQFIITNVRGPGYDTIEEAIAAPPSNKTILDYVVTTIDLSSHDVVSNGNYYLGITNSRYITYTDDNPDTWYHAFSIVTDYFSKTGWTPIKNQITSTEGITCNVSQISSTTSYSEPLEVKVQFNSVDSGRVDVWLGNLTLSINVVRKVSLIPAEGVWFYYCKYMKNPDNSNGYWDYGYYLTSGTVDNKDIAWIKLAPGSDFPPVAAENYTSGPQQFFPPDRAKLTNVTDAVTSGHGKIQVYIEENETTEKRTGTYYLSTGYNPYWAPQSKVERIKFDITQLGQP